MGILDAIKKRGRPPIAKDEPKMPVNEVEELPIGEQKDIIKQEKPLEEKVDPVEEYLKQHAEMAAMQKYDELRLLTSIDMRLANLEKAILGDDKK